MGRSLSGRAEPTEEELDALDAAATNEKYSSTRSACAPHNESM